MQRLISIALTLASSVALAQTPAPPAVRSAPSRPDSTSAYVGLGAESLTPAEVARYAAPALDRKISRRLQMLLDVRGPGAGLITARGDRMIFSSQITGTAQVFRQDGAMKFPVQLTGGEDATLPLALAPDDSFVVVSRDVGGEENPGLYWLPLEGGPLREIQDRPKVQTLLAYISDDSKSLYFHANDVASDSYAIYSYDLKTAQRELVFDRQGLWRVSDHRGDRTWLLTKQVGSLHTEIYEYDLTTRQLSPLLGQGEDEDYTAVYGAGAGQVLVRTNKLSDFYRLYLLENGKLTAITPEIKHDIASFKIDQVRQRVYYVVNEDGYMRLHVLDARTFRELALPKLPDADNVQITNASRNGRFIEIALDGAGMVPQTLTLDWQTRQLTTWRVPNQPERTAGSFTRATLEYYPARDGTRIPMFVRRPASCAAPCPVIVDFHGGPEGQATAAFSSTAQAFVDAGFVYVTPNVRGSTGYGKAWLHADDGPRRLAVISDIEDCARFIRASWSRDGKQPRIGVTGGSYGGYAVLMAMTYFAGAYDVGVEQVGISNLISFLANTAPYRRVLRISEYGDPVKDKAALIQLSPITHVGKIKSPLLLIQGLNDPRVPVGEAVQIYQQLEQRKVPTGLIVFPDEGHGARKRNNRVLALGHTIAFFEKYLLGK